MCIARVNAASAVPNGGTLEAVLGVSSTHVVSGDYFGVMTLCEAQSANPLCTGDAGGRVSRIVRVTDDRVLTSSYAKLSVWRFPQHVFDDDDEDDQNWHPKGHMN